MAHTWSAKPCSPLPPPPTRSTSFVQWTKPLLVLLVLLASSVENTFFTLFHSCTRFREGVVLGYCCNGNIYPSNYSSLELTCGCGDFKHLDATVPLPLDSLFRFN